MLRKLDVTRSYLHADAMFFLRFEEALHTLMRKSCRNLITLTLNSRKYFNLHQSS